MRRVLPILRPKPTPQFPTESLAGFLAGHNQIALIELSELAGIVDSMAAEKLGCK
jgi:hypothetical protein